MITKLILRCRTKVFRFDKKSFFINILGFSTYWDYKNCSGSGDEYYSEKNRNLNISKRIHLNCDFNDGSVINGVREPNLYSFVLEKSPGYKVFPEPATIHYKKINELILNTKTFP